MVYILLADGFEEIEALATADILRRAEIKTELVSVNNTEYVKGAHGICVKADVFIKNICDDFDMLNFPGGAPGYVNLEKNPGVKLLADKALSTDKFIAAICAAPSVLGKWGYLKGKKAACYPSFEKYLEGAEVVCDDVVHDGNIITSRGAGTAHKFAFKIVEILKDKNLAQYIEKSMIYRHE